MRAFVTGLVAAALLAAPAAAADVTFTGVLSGVCTLAVPTPGLLGLSTDGTRLGSEEPGGLAATVTILSVGTHTITVSAPTRTAAPPEYVSAGEQVEVAYSGLGGLSLVNRAYTASSSTFGVSTLPLTSLLVHNRITNSAGFAAGTYTTKTVVTCS